MRWLDKFIRNRRWFRITTPDADEISGSINSQGIDFHARSGWDEVHVQIPREFAEKLKQWLVAVLPDSGDTDSNVKIIRFPETKKDIQK
jgi:hypothetical protein